MSNFDLKNHALEKLGPTTIPTHEDYLKMKAAIDPELFELEYRRAYVAAFVKRGIPYDMALDNFHAVDFDELSETPPYEAAENEIDCWGNDGDYV